MEAGLQRLLGHNVLIVHCAAGCLGEAWTDIAAVAAGLGAERAGAALVADLRRRMDVAAGCGRGRRRPRVLCIQWTVRGGGAAAGQLAFCASVHAR